MRNKKPRLPKTPPQRFTPGEGKAMPPPVMHDPEFDRFRKNQIDLDIAKGSEDVIAGISSGKASLVDDGMRRLKTLLSVTWGKDNIKIRIYIEKAKRWLKSAAEPEKIGDSDADQ